MNLINHCYYDIESAECIVLDFEMSRLTNGSSILNPIDPNPAISAHAVFPQSGHIRPEKRPFFQNFLRIFPN